MEELMRRWASLRRTGRMPGGVVGSLAYAILELSRSRDIGKLTYLKHGAHDTPVEIVVILELLVHLRSDLT